MDDWGYPHDLGHLQMSIDTASIHTSLHQLRNFSTAQAAVAEKKWRFGYVKHVVKQTQLASANEETALGTSNTWVNHGNSNDYSCYLFIVIPK